MPKLTDETLMLYADGLLVSPEKEHVEMLLTEDKKLRSRLNVFRLTGPGLGMLMEDHINSPVPDSLMNCLAERAPKRFSFARAQESLTGILDLVMHKLGSAANWSLQPVLAAVLALIAGVGLGWQFPGGADSNIAFLGQLVQLEEDLLVAQGNLQQILENSISGTNSTVTLSDSRQVAIGARMTFRNEAGDNCREYEITNPATEYYAGVACRIDGKWVVRIQSMTAPHATGSNRIVPASGGDRLAMDAIVNALVAGAPLAHEEEAALINNHWNE